MREQFFQKKGEIVMQLAQYLLQMQVGDRIPIISEFQEKFDASRGTIQNAFNFLKDEQAIVLISKGHQGTFISMIDEHILQQFAIQDVFIGTMPLPYSRSYEGLATGLSALFHEKGIKLNMAYVRGSSPRLASIVSGNYQFAVTSKFAAEHAIEAGQPIEIVVDLGAYSYLSQHMLLLSKPEATEIQDGDRVGIDLGSIDQKELTYLLTENKKVTYIDMPGHQLIHEIVLNNIDAGVWNYDEIIDKNYQQLNYQLIKDVSLSVKLSTAVLVCKKNDYFSKTILEKNINTKEILAIQTKVKSGEMIPRY